MSLPLPKVPVYEVSLPVSKIKIKYRPFLVKEEKILLLALEDNSSSDMVDAIKQIIFNCTMEKADVEKMPVADIEYLFIQIRKRSISEMVDTFIECAECGTHIDYKVDLSKVEVVNGVTDRNINIGDDFIVTMKFPTIETTKLITAANAADVTLESIASMIELITYNEEAYDMVDFTMEDKVQWLENLSKAQMNKLNDFLVSLPKIVFDDQIKCTCGASIKIHMEGLESFFGQ